MNIYVYYLKFFCEKELSLLPDLTSSCWSCCFIWRGHKRVTQSKCFLLGFHSPKANKQAPSPFSSQTLLKRKKFKVCKLSKQLCPMHLCKINLRKEAKFMEVMVWMEEYGIGIGLHMCKVSLSRSPSLPSFLLLFFPLRWRLGRMEGRKGNEWN